MPTPSSPLSPAQAESLTLELYGLRVTASPLPSERDQNFLLQAGGEPALILKVANANEDPAFLAAVHRAMEAVASHSALTPQVVPTRDGRSLATAVGPDGVERMAWAISVVPGVPLGTVSHRPMALWGDVGRAVAHLTRGLAGFDDPALHRDFAWQLTTGRAVVARNRRLIRDADLGTAIDRLMAAYDRHTAGLLPRLRQGAVHNDLNDYNLLVGGSPGPFERFTRVTGIIDFGDMVHGPVVGDLAVAAAYPLLDAPDPLTVLAELVRGYHAAWSMTGDEMEALWGLAMLRLCLSVAMAAEQQARDPGNSYLGISQEPIRRTLPRLAVIPFGLAAATVRTACGREPAAHAGMVREFLQAGTASFAPVLGVDLRIEPSLVLDLSVGSPDVEGDPATAAEPMSTARIEAAMERAGVEVAIGRYDEPRHCYTTPAFAGGDGTLAEPRTIHLGLDLFAPAGTPVVAPLDGVVHAADQRALQQDYGGVLILDAQGAAIGAVGVSGDTSDNDEHCALAGIAAAGLGAAARCAALPPAAPAAAGEFGVTAAAAVAAAQQLHAVGDDFRRVLLDAVLVGVLARLQPPLDVDGPALLQVLAGDFRLPPEQHDAVPLGLLLLLAALVLPGVGGRDVEVGDRVARSGVAGFGITAEVADQDHFVDGGHNVSPIE